MDCVPLGPIEAVFRGTKNHISDLTSQDEHISASLENILGSSSISWIISSLRVLWVQPQLGSSSGDWYFSRLLLSLNNLYEQ